MEEKAIAVGVGKLCDTNTRKPMVTWIFTSRHHRNIHLDADRKIATRMFAALPDSEN